MAYEAPVFSIPGLVAGADLSDYQYYLVKLNSTAQQVVRCDAVTDIPIGILQNDPESGEAAEVMALGVSKLKLGTTITKSQLIGTDTSGAAAVKATTTTSEMVVGQCIEGGAAGEYGTVTVNCLGACRAV